VIIDKEKLDCAERKEMIINKPKQNYVEKGWGV
jgi:hypothetical protein